MKNKPIALLASLACVLFAVALAPNTNTASADYGHHYDDPEAQMWYEFAHDKGIEINHILQINYAAVEFKAEYAAYAIHRLCMNDCPTRDMERRLERRRREIARKARLDIAKCIWQAQMELETCYQGARQQLEDAGYDYFLPYIYNPYRNTQSHLVRLQREANRHLNEALYCIPL